MGLPVILSAVLSLLLASSTTATPHPSSVYSGSEYKLVVTRKFFPDSSIKYTSQHDIVNLLVPLNKINFDDDDDSDEEGSNNVTFFFTEADIENNGDRQYKGLSVYHNGKATKVLENGRDATAFNDDSKKVYIGATNGIYIYEDGATKKYGALSDSIIQIEADNQTGTVYFLTEDHQLFSVGDEGDAKNKVEDVKDVKEFVVDYNSNIFYYDSNEHLHVFNQDGVKKFEDLPKDSTVKLVRPMFSQDEGASAVIGKKVYVINPNATLSPTPVTMEVAPTAYAPDATLLQYYALDKKIYEYNVMDLFVSNFKDLKDYLNDKKDEINKIATKSRSAFGA
ncbi:hypothetical protein MSG28_015773 [Choristoneura fumiferana]|uniref:Uncharacterized protein n=1 Tax=Choristoneura fumiferana TaxID=7141 RepID=A0ACC0KC82_CHOFU|nr:hypothetical protein MSG28_015773 [Choristoneura fumiferana]